MKKLSSIFLIAIMLTISLILPINQKQAKAFSSSAECYVLMNVETGKVLASRNANRHHLIASCTKILTAIVVIEEFEKQNKPLDTVVKVDKKAVGIEGSSIYLKLGEELTVRDLLYGLMLRSGNDSATQLAITVGGTVENFAVIMNEYAQRLGCADSNFVTPSGLDAKDQYSSAIDLAIISAYALKNKTFKEISSATQYTVQATNLNNARVLYNKNKLLKMLEGANGVKTGFTKKAGRCFVGSGTRLNKQGVETTFIAVVLNCGPMFENSRDLINEAFNKFEVIKLIDETVLPENIKPISNKLELIDKIKEESDNDRYETVVEYNGKIGFARVLNNGIEIYAEKIESIFEDKTEGKNEDSYFDAVKEVIENFNDAGRNISLIAE